MSELPEGVTPAPPLPEGHASEALEAAPTPDAITEVVGISGKPAKVPSGLWFAQTDGTGGLARDADGRPIRVRSPHRPPRTPPTALGR